jgi:endonuclease/exonuclease/phosphatase family metal-dependent hydrolase
VLHKGILQTRLMIEGVQVVVLNTHLTANYSGDWGRDNLYARNEWQQLAQLAEAVRAQPADALVLVAGDFNIPRGTWLYHDFIDASGLTDPMANDDTPTYRPFSRLMEKRYSHAIDYTLYRAPMPVTAVARQVHTGKTRLVNGREGYISDHNGIELTLTW